jgi:hypothetical protein
MAAKSSSLPTSKAAHPRASGKAGAIQLEESSHAQLNSVARLLNERPRKTLAFPTSADTLTDLLRGPVEPKAAFFAKETK